MESGVPAGRSCLLSCVRIRSAFEPALAFDPDPHRNGEPVSVAVRRVTSWRPPVNSKEFLKNERLLAKRYGVRKTDVLFQMVRCEKCASEALLRSRFARHDFGSVEAIEQQILLAVSRDVDAACGSCEIRPLKGDGSRHVFLTFSERQQAHLAVTLKMRREDDGRTRVTRRVWFVPLDGAASDIDPEDGRLDDFWADARIRRCALEPDAESAAAALEGLAEKQPRDPILFRELGHALLEAGRTGRALGAWEMSLGIDNRQPDVLRQAGRLYFSFGRSGDATDHLVRAYDISGDAVLLPEIIRAAYRSRRLGALAASAEEFLVVEPESVLARKGLAATLSVTDVGAMRDAWAALRDASQAAGERRTEAVARFWARALDLPLPDWQADQTLADYRGALCDELRGLDIEVDDAPDPLEWGEASIPIDLEVMTPGGDRYFVCLCDHVPTAVTDHKWKAAIRASADDPRHSPVSLLPLSRQPMSYGVMRYASGAPDAALDLDADADTTMSVNDENTSAFVVAAERHFGRNLDFSLASLKEVDAILSAFHDDGFGEMTFAMQCQAAAYVGDVVSGLVEDSRWEDGEAPMDPRIFRLGTGEELNLVSKVGKAVRNGSEDAVAHFVQVVVHHLLER